MNVTQREVQKLTSRVEGMCSDTESSVLNTDVKQGVQAICKSGHTNTSFHIKDFDLHCQEDNHKNTILQKEMLKGAVVGQNSGQKENKDGRVHEEVQFVVNSLVPSSTQTCKKKLDMASGVDVQRQWEVSDPLFQTNTGESGRKLEQERTKFQNIVCLDGKSFLCKVCQITLLSNDSVEQHVAGRQHAKNLAIAAVNIEHLWKTVRELEGGRTNNIHMTSHNKFRCKLCWKNIDATDVVSHVGGSTHQQKLEDLKARKRKDTNVSQKWIALDVHDIWNEIYKAENGKWSNIRHTFGRTFQCEPCKVKLSVDDVLAHVVHASHQEAIKVSENVQVNEKLRKILGNLWQNIHAADRTHQVYFKIDTSTAVYCTSCHVRVPATVKNVIDHIRGKTHMTIVLKHRTSSQLPPAVKERDTSKDKNSPNLKATQTRNFEKERMKMKSKSVISKDLLNFRSSQSITHKTAYNAQDALVKALMPKETRSSDQSASMLQQRSVSFHCILCDTVAESAELWNQHICSQEHRNEASKLTVEGKNLITYNCPSCSATIFCVQSDFEEHFCQRVENRVPSNDMNNEIAGNTQQLNESSAAKSFHQENMKHEEQADKTDNVPRIIVTGFPQGVGMELLYNFFKDFGTVCFVALNRESAVIEFIENEAVQKALARPLLLGNATLTVKTLTHFNRLVTEPAISVHESLMSTFTSPQSVQMELNALCRTSSSVFNKEKDEQVCQFLETSFSEIFPGCKAHPFGSRMSGLAFPDSDLDVFLDTGGMYNGEHKQESYVQELMVSVAESRLKDLPECCKVEGVPSARTPIVRFLHKPSGVRCDMAFRHGLGCENTKLIKFFVSLDPRVQPLIIFLKHWAHIHELTGPCNITSYALVWLVIFYLQEASGFGLPSVEFLLKHNEGEVRSIAVLQTHLCETT